MNNKQVISLGIAGLLIAAIFGFYAVNVPKENSAPAASANDEILLAWDNLAHAGSAHLAIDLNISLPNSEVEAVTQPVVDIAVQTEGDATWQEKAAYGGTFTITTKGRGMQLFTDGDIFILPDTTQFKLQNLPTLLNPSGDLLNKWTSVQASLLRTTNPEELRAAFASIFTNWTPIGPDNSLERYEKTFSEEEEAQLESVFRLSSSGSQALHVFARLVKNFNIHKAEAWVSPDTNELRLLKFHFTDNSKPDQQAALQFAFNDQGKQVVFNIPEAETSVQPEIFTQLFGEPLAPPTPTQ